MIRTTPFNPTAQLQAGRYAGRVIQTAALICMLALACTPQDSPGKKVPSVTMAPAPLNTITRGQAGSIQLRFRIGNGFHINSNTPKSEYLIPTTLKLTAPTDIVIGKVSYPAGEDSSFPFAPDEKLNVYTGEFPIDVTLRPLAHVVPGKYAIHGELKYQACDNAACYPPKKLPVTFDVAVAKATKSKRTGSNPAQSPHIHQ